jgi:phosphate-selective porin
MTRVPKVVAGLVALTGMFVVPALISAQSTPPTDPSTGVHWRNRPSIQLGPHVRIDVRARIAGDWRVFEQEIDAEHWAWRMRRAGVQGRFGKHVNFEVERDLNPDGRWRDVFLNWGTFHAFELQAGRFKVPFGREQLMSASRIDFASRALISETVAPGRATGVMAHGRVRGRSLTYAAGIFDGDGDNGELDDALSTDWHSPSYAVRITGEPFTDRHPLVLGAAVGGVDVPEGLNSSRGISVLDAAEFFAPLYVKGRRTRVGLEATYSPGPISLSAEWMQMREQRRDQGIGDVDLSDLITRGWYAAATWLMTGEDKDGFDSPARPFPNRGFGALELGVRYEALGFESADQTGPAFRNPRAEHVFANGDRVWTLGVSWFANRWTRVIANAMREKFADATRTPVPEKTNFWSGVLRLQLAF